MSDFSVLISVYFKENPIYLRQSLESVISQTLRPNEIVLVKDGPLTLELASIINEYEENYEEKLSSNCFIRKQRTCQFS